MITIELQVSEDMVGKYGVKALINRLQQYLEAERLKIQAEEIQEAVLEAGEKNDDLFDIARKKAWQEYKEKHLRNLLP